MAQVHASSGKRVSLRPLGAHIGQARTTAILKTPQLALIRRVFRQGAALREHQVAHTHGQGPDPDRLWLGA